MPVYKYFVVVGSALWVLIAISDGLFGEPADPHRFDVALFDNATYTPRVAAAGTAGERDFSDDIAPAERVREVFDRFSYNAKRARRYSSRSASIW